jgi:hypothetical protein
MAQRALSCIGLGYLVASISVGQPARAEPSTSDKLQTILAKGEPDTRDLDGIRNMGPGALVELARIYERSSDDMKRRVAHLFYQFGLKSNDAKRVLMRDVHTSQAALRLEVQWALAPTIRSTSTRGKKPACCAK